MKSKEIYMDFNSTTPMAIEVVDAVKESCVNLWANPSSRYEPGVDAKKSIEESRQHIANMVKCNSNEIVFTSGGTEANNWVIYSSIKEFHKTKTSSHNDRPHIVTSNVEHDSIRLILEKLIEDGEVDVTFVPVSKVTGSVEAEEIIEAITPQSVLITVMLANNETGILQPVNGIGELLRTVNAHRTWPKILFHTDAAQAIGKLSIDVNDLGVDYLTIVGHKFYAPRIGGLYRKSTSPLHPIFFGGGQEGGLRPGTENTSMIVGLGVAARLVCENALNYEKHMLTQQREMERLLLNRFGNLIAINGQVTSKYGRLPNTVSVTFKNEELRGQKILGLCSKLCASVGAACHSGESSKPSSVLIASGVDPALASCTIRLSLGRETQLSDIETAVDELGIAVATILHESNK